MVPFDPLGTPRASLRRGVPSTQHFRTCYCYTTYNKDMLDIFASLC